MSVWTNYEFIMEGKINEIKRYMDDYLNFIQKMDCKITKEDIARVMELIDMRLQKLIEDAINEQTYLDRKYPIMDPKEIAERDRIRQEISDLRSQSRDIRLNLIDKIMQTGKICGYPIGSHIRPKPM